MKKSSNKITAAQILVSSAKCMMTNAANSRCAFIYHQPKQPQELKKLRKF